MPSAIRPRLGVMSSGVCSSPSLDHRSVAGQRGLLRHTAKLKTTAFIPPQPAAKHAAAEQARERMRTRTGRDAAFDRQAHAEGLIAERKRHGADRARCRGIRLLILAFSIDLATTLTTLGLLVVHAQPRKDQAPCPATPGPRRGAEQLFPGSPPHSARCTLEG